MSEGKKLKKELLQKCESLGAKKVGIIRAESLKDSEAVYAAMMKILPEAKSVISFLVPFPKGCLHLLKDPTRGLPFYTRLAGIGGRTLDGISINICLFLEEHGFVAAPVFICTPLEMPKSLDLWGYLSQIDVAAKSGLGWIGKNGLLTSPVYGPRVGLGTVLTNAVIEEDRQSDVGKCPDDCFICVEKCPAGALDGTGKVNRLNCTATQAIAPISLMMTKEFSMKEHRDMIVNVGAVDEHTWYRCNNCVVHCPIGL
ncbi:MAG: epoxyqueuosine reductase [Candidatus Abyssobacteria bacterium SURF_17]|uniref:Epoxyqueuosine reductase n=1 Tax=Candidatus Abyssobacteria bacterium SURF_17 TaxID=2093361 RepID=A0A419ENY0_9BACT|nr:MAG: epoxyqueuosine reductase [Candidatus Abyssubacteria bacterium SURF_17]